MRIGTPVSPIATTTMLAILALAVAVPAVAVTINKLTVTFTVNGHMGSGVFRVTDIDGDGMVTLNVSDDLVSRVQEAFGTSTFAFPGQYMATFEVDARTLTVELQSEDTFILNLV